MDWDKDFFSKVSIEADNIADARVIGIENRKRDNIHSTHYMRIGDHVVMHMDEEARGYGRGGVPDGTIGVVVGFKQYEDYYGRINNFGHVPGKYLGNGAPTIKWFDGSVSTSTGGSDVYFLFDHEKKMKERRADKAYNAAFDYKARVADLPETPFWEMDVVKILSPRLRRSWDSDFLRITQIDYRSMNDKRNDGSPMPIYEVTALEEGRGRMTINPEDIELHERGNLWKWFNGERDKVVFKDIQEELAFHFALGMDDQIPCPQSGNYHWPFSAILPALKAGTIDVIKHQSGFFGASGSMAAYKMRDRDLGERARATSLEGFDREKSPMRTRVIGKEWNATMHKEIVRRAIEFDLPFLNIDYGQGFVDTSEMVTLGIKVIEMEVGHIPDVEKIGGYIYFFPKNASMEATPPFTSHIEVNEDADALVTAMGRTQRKDRMRVRVQSDKGWSDKNREIVIAACRNFGVIFADRKSLDYKAFETANVGVLEVGDADDVPIEFELNGYVFFTHRGMKDLPYDVTVKGE